MLVSSRLRAGLVLGASVLVVAGLVSWLGRESDAPLDQLLAQAQAALRNRQLQQAESAARQVLSRDPQSKLALLIAGKAAGKLGRTDEALALFDRIPDDGSEESVEGLNLHGELLSFLNRFDDAEKKFRQSLQRRPTFMAHHRMAHFLSMEGRYVDARPHLFYLLRSGKFSQEELELLGMGFKFVAKRAKLEEYLAAYPANIGPLLGLALRARDDGDLDEAEKLLRRMLSAEPRHPDAQAWLGWVLWHRTDQEGLDTWLSEVTPEAERHPITWVVRGQVAKDRGERPAAIRCFWEALRRDPHQMAANAQLAILLSAEGESSSAELFRRREQRLLEMSDLAEAAANNKDNASMLFAMARSVESQGRLWEAWGWCELILRINAQDQQAQSLRDRLQPLLNDDALLSPDADPTLLVDLSRYPLPDWRTVTSQEVPRSQNMGSAVRFHDSASELGLNFVCYQGTRPGTSGRRFLETTGGGVAAFDFDGDAWPDLYFSQGADWPLDPEQSAYLDKLFRNRGDAWQDITAAAGLGDNRFSQGIAAGDFNNDGFPDLYLANLGANRLYRNNGDGTFSDVTAESGVDDKLWTTSCLIADLNGDGWPDLYDANYVEDEFVEVVLFHNDDPQVVINPFTRPVQDMLWLSRGDGRFEDVSQEAGIPAPMGLGLGVVAADFNDSGLLSVFVANDHAPNFFYANQTPRRGDRPRFAESGLTTGLALDRDGLPRASMGVAADDADGDGSLDLFVTNFEYESNTLYLNIGQGQLFSDETIAAGLREPSVPMVAWGTQFIDADLDGWPDLIVTNGHVDEKERHPFLMRPQFFRNLGRARFVELPASTLGPFFAREYRGAALARLDWNRDGREDAVISHIDQPAALLTNQTAGAGHFLAIQLHGTTADRDAIGAIVRAQSGDRTLVKQVVGGDGFHCTNQRQLVFGLGPEVNISELTVRWPSGLKQSFHDVPADAEFVLIEGAEALVRLPGTER